MNYTLMPSLEHFALIKTVLTLWNPDDICLLTATFCFIGEEWKVAENRVIEKVKELPLPESLKKKVLGFILPIGMEIRDFFNRYLHALSDGIKDRFRNSVRKGFKKLCWTPQGTINEKKTAERLIRDENLNITTRYIIACINCLENDILMLWNKMPEDCKKSFYSVEDPRLVNQDELVVLWTYDIKGEVTKMHHMCEEKWHGCTPYQYAFDYAVYSGKKAATEYFLQKLTSEEREESLEISVYPKKDTLCYLLSQMNEVQQVGIFRKYPYNVLSWRLDWPFQSLFLETSKHVWDSLPKSSYYGLLRSIVYKVKHGFKDYNYQKLFRDFWQQSPLTYKKFTIDEFVSGSILLYLLQVNDKENIKLILKDATTLDREKIIFSTEGKNLCEFLINENEMDLLEFFVQECILSKDQMIKFREEFERFLVCSKSKEVQEAEKDKWNNVFQLLNDFTHKFDTKRCVEERNNSPVKILCSLTSE